MAKQPNRAAQRTLVVKSLEFRSCKTCLAALQVRNPTDTLRCHECGSSLRQRWQVQRRMGIYWDYMATHPEQFERLHRDIQRIVT